MNVHDPVMAEVIGKAATLVEALPWLARFSGQTVVVKYGGSAMVDPELRRGFAQDVVFLRYCGIRVVVVHGGGPQITASLHRLGLPAVFAGGHRVTTAETIDVVRTVLLGEVNDELVDLINAHGSVAAGLSGEDVLTAVRRGPELVAGEQIDLGLVGDVAEVRVDRVRELLGAGRMPVIASVARSADGQLLNLNADPVAAALSVVLQAAKLVVLTDVEGLYADWDGSSGVLVSELSAAELRTLLPSLAGGMIPKMLACLTALDGGVPAAHLLDGRVPHALLLEIFTDSGVGTMVTS